MWKLPDYPAAVEACEGWLDERMDEEGRRAEAEAVTTRENSVTDRIAGEDIPTAHAGALQRRNAKPNEIQQ